MHLNLDIVSNAEQMATPQKPRPPPAAVMPQNMSNSRIHNHPIQAYVVALQPLIQQAAIASAFNAKTNFKAALPFSIIETRANHQAASHQ